MKYTPLLNDNHPKVAKATLFAGGFLCLATLLGVVLAPDRLWALIPPSILIIIEGFILFDLYKQGIATSVRSSKEGQK